MNRAPHPFTLRQLQYAVAVADLLSFRKAAQACFVSQPSLSAQLAQLEDALGVRLFERDRRGVLITVAGKALIERARTLLTEVEDLAELARRSGDPFSGQLRLGVIPTVSPYLLPPITRTLRKKYPALTTLWTEDRTEALVRQLESGALDGAIVALGADVAQFDHQKISDDVFDLATAKDHPLGAGKGPVTAAELRNADVLLLDEGHCLRDQALAFCSKARAHELEFRATSMATLTQMIAAGSGVTLLPRLAVPLESRRFDLKVRPFADPPPKRTLALVWRKRSPISTSLQAVGQTIAAAYPVAT